MLYKCGFTAAAGSASANDWWIPLAVLALVIAAEPFIANHFGEAK